jgi:probable DNA metabolism protein
LDDAVLVYLYDGTLEGLLTAVFAAYGRHEEPANIVEACDLQESLLCSYVPIATELRYATRVKGGILRELGEACYEDVKRVFLSDDANKGGVIYRFVHYAMEAGRRAPAHLAEPAVADFVELRKRVENEAHYMLQFVRFAHLTNGVFFARIRPKASVVPLITEHFARRFNVQPFIIYDSVHHLASVFDTERWWLVDASEVCVPGVSEAEEDYQALWQTFFDTLAIEERRNPRCQRNFMPKRFWGDMCEHVPPELRKKRPTAATPTETMRKSVEHAGRQLPANRPKELAANTADDAAKSAP